MFNTDHFHPVVVHFPIALLMVAFLLDLLSCFFRKEVCLSKAAFWLLILGTLGALAAVLTGEFFTADLSGEVGKLLNTHEILAKSTLFIAIAASLLRGFTLWKNLQSPTLNWIILFCMLLIAGFVSATGFFGGSMVYDFMIGL
jgi:uncharacterized membrane protein